MNTKSCECFWTTQNYFESSNEKFQKSSFLDFEYGSGFASLFKNIKNDAFDIFYSNTIQLHWRLKFCGYCTWLADFKGLWNLKKSQIVDFLTLSLRILPIVDKIVMLSKEYLIGPKVDKTKSQKQQNLDLKDLHSYPGALPESIFSGFL